MQYKCLVNQFDMIQMRMQYKSTTLHYQIPEFPANLSKAFWIL